VETINDPKHLPAFFAQTRQEQPETLQLRIFILELLAAGVSVLQHEAGDTFETDVTEPCQFH